MANITKYIARFEDGDHIVATTEHFKNRLAFYNYICNTRQGEKHGKLLEIEERPYIK